MHTTQPRFYVLPVVREILNASGATPERKQRELVTASLLMRP